MVKKTKGDYEKIAEFFSLKRKFFWPELEEIKRYIKEKDKILDFGCGHGRLLLFLKNMNVDYVGVDVSPKIISIAKKNFPKYTFQVVDKLRLPFSDSFFNVICCVATIHHIPSFKLRKSLLKEFKRLLKKDGVLILTSWYLWKGKKGAVFKYILKWYLAKLKYFVFKKDTEIGLGKEKVKINEIDFKDIFIPWKNDRGEIIAYRYFHAFSKKELARLVEKAGFRIKELKILKRGKRFANIFLVAIKP